MRKFLYLFLILSFPLSALDVQKDIVQEAKKYVGKPYRYGGTGPNSFDCSGFIYFIYMKHVPGISRTTDILAGTGTAVKRKDLLPGDLTFWATGSNPKEVSHVAIYIGNNRIIHAISDGPNRGIAITDINSPYWKDRYLFARRVLKYDSTKQTTETVRMEPAAAEQGTSSAGPAAAGATGGGQTLVTVLGRYTGDVENGQPHGTGRYVLKNGDVYEGSMRNGRFHGPGRYESTKGTIWTGVFRNGVLTGKAVRRWAGGEVYAGEYVNGLESGGWYTDRNGKFFWVFRNSSGEWIVDRRKTAEREGETARPAPDKRADKNTIESGPGF
ncbi:MAG: C40 family peptidase [Spirochaetales bacterium]|nr:C40 family peptidase [Spirochaetales bacterium]